MANADLFRGKKYNDINVLFDETLAKLGVEVNDLCAKSLKKGELLMTTTKFHTANQFLRTLRNYEAQHFSEKTFEPDEFYLECEKAIT